MLPWLKVILSLTPANEWPTPLVLRLRSRSGEQDINRLGHIVERLSPSPKVGNVDQLGRSVKLVAL